jgi:hypothetical protein
MSAVGAVHSAPRTLQQLCVACVDLLGVTGAGASVMTDHGSGGTVGVSGEVADQVEEWQITLGEGPGPDAYARDRPVLVGDLEDDNSQSARWPVFAGRMREAGLRAIFAFPVRLGNRPIGVLNLFRDRAGLLSREQIGVARALADLAGTLLDRDTPECVPSGSGASAYRYEVHQATGMIAAQLGTSAEEALVRLRAKAFAQERTVGELANEVVSRRLRFTEDDQ